MSEEPAGPRRRRKQARPGEILEAAFEEFALHGFAATRLDDVAVRAGITKGTIYLYFSSKEELFVGTFKEMIRPTLDHLAAEPRGPAMVILRAYFRIVYNIMVHDRQGRELLRMIIAEGGRFPSLAERWHDEIIVPVTGRLADVVHYGVERGEFRSIAAKDFPQLMISPVLSASTWRILFAERHAFDLDTYYETHLDMLERTLLVSMSANPQ